MALGSVTAGSAPRATIAADTAATFQQPTKATPHIDDTYSRLALYFEANVGQTDPRVKFLSRGARHAFFLTSTGATFAFSRTDPSDASRRKAHAAMRMTVSGSSASPRVKGTDQLTANANYLIGNDPAKWHTNVPTYAKVIYEDLYPRIDLVYYGNHRQVEYDFVVHPGGNYKKIGLRFEGIETLKLDSVGDLVLHTAVGDVRMRKPLVYQEINGVRREIASTYALRSGREVGFEIARHDATKPLTIDPVLFYSTYLGGSGFDSGLGITVDPAGNAYVAGFTSSANFPTVVGAFQTSSAGGVDAFVAKLNPTGSGLVYATYLGGSADDLATTVAVDASGSVYLTGVTSSTNFPTSPGAFQPTYGGGSQDGFVAKLNSSGSALIYSSYLGGSGQDNGLDIAADAAGAVYVCGLTSSSDFPTTPGAFQTSFGGGVYDAFVTKVDATASSLLYSTYLGGSGQDQGARLTVDSTGNAYTTGLTTSANFPTAAPFQSANAGNLDAFVTKVNTTGTALIYSTYLGGGNVDSGAGIAVDMLGNTYVSGETGSTNFPTTIGAFQTTYAGGIRDFFVTKLNPSGSALVYSTYLGGSANDETAAGADLAVDPTGNTYVAGRTNSTDFPTMNPIQAANAGTVDLFITKVNPLGSALVYSTYLGGAAMETSFGLAIDAMPNPNVYVTGLTASTDFPTTSGAFQTASAGGNEAFVVKIADVVVPPPPTVGKVTGGGTIDVPGGLGNFGFIVQANASGQIGGNLQYKNHATGEKIHSVMFTSFVIAGNTATFSGTCTKDGIPCTFAVEVMDNGEPGTDDTFTITVDAGAPQGGMLRSGNIQIHE